MSGAGKPNSNIFGMLTRNIATLLYIQYTHARIIFTRHTPGAYSLIGMPDAQLYEIGLAYML